MTSDDEFLAQFAGWETTVEYVRQINNLPPSQHFSISNLVTSVFDQFIARHPSLEGDGDTGQDRCRIQRIICYRARYPSRPSEHAPQQQRQFLPVPIHQHPVTQGVVYPQALPYQALAFAVAAQQLGYPPPGSMMLPPAGYPPSPYQPPQHYANPGPSPPQGQGRYSSPSSYTGGRRQYSDSARREVPHVIAAGATGSNSAATGRDDCSSVLSHSIATATSARTLQGAPTC